MHKTTESNNGSYNVGQMEHVKRLSLGGMNALFC